MQIALSPSYGRPDSSLLPDPQQGRGRIDPVSVADLLFNAFVQPPHSIFEGVKLASFGIHPLQDLDTTARPKLRDSGKRSVRTLGGGDWSEHPMEAP